MPPTAGEPWPGVCSDFRASIRPDTETAKEEHATGAQYQPSASHRARRAVRTTLRSTRKVGRSTREESEWHAPLVVSRSLWRRDRPDTPVRTASLCAPAVSGGAPQGTTD